MFYIKKQCTFLVLILFVFAERVKWTTHFSDEWGVSTITLGKERKDVQLQHILNLDSDVLVLNNLHNVSGNSEAISSSVYKITYSNDTLFVLFRCIEPIINFPQPEVGHIIKWHNLLNTPVEQDAYIPDKINFFLQHLVNEKGYYQFCATVNGEKFGAKFHYEISQSGLKKEIRSHN